MAMFAPLLLGALESGGASLVGKEAFEGVKKLANLGMSHYGKDISPAHLLHKIVQKGAKVIRDPDAVKHVLEQGGKAFDIASGGASKFSGVFLKHGILTPKQNSQFSSFLGKSNMGFHHALRQMGKVHGHLLPFLRK